MITRRKTIFCLSSAAAATVLPTSSGLTAARSTVKTPINFDMPRGGCDCHAHVFDPERFPYLPKRPVTAAAATAADLRSLMSALHLDRVVLVQPVHYGTDHSCLLDATRQLAPNARGLAIIDQSTPRGLLEELDAGGFRGVRLNFETFGVANPDAIKSRIDAVTEAMRGLKWHLHFFSRPSVIAKLRDHLVQQPLPVVIDHFGGAQAAEGPNQPGFDAVIDLVRTGHAYMKISGANRISGKDPDYSDATLLAQAFVKANPDRILWGSDWPHLPGPIAGLPLTEISPPLDIDDGLVINQLPKWVPDPAIRRKVLVDNPARLYGFRPVTG